VVDSLPGNEANEFFSRVAHPTSLARARRLHR
jgi:hypothetical protein